MKSQRKRTRPPRPAPQIGHLDSLAAAGGIREERLDGVERRQVSVGAVRLSRCRAVEQAHATTAAVCTNLLRSPERRLGVEHARRHIAGRDVVDQRPGDRGLARALPPARPAHCPSASRTALATRTGRAPGTDTPRRRHRAAGGATETGVQAPRIRRAPFPVATSWRGPGSNPS